MIIDNRTANLDLPLPNPDNLLGDDVLRLIQALESLDLAVFGRELLANKGAANGYAPLSGGLIPSQYLPGFVDDVLEFASLATFPVTGETGKIYVALDSGFQYRWSGTVYVELGRTYGVASSTVLGLIRIGTGLSIDGSGIVSVSYTIPDASVTSAQLADNAVITAKINNLAVTTAKIADANVTDVKLASNAVTTVKIANLAVTAAKIADLNVTTAKIADLAVSTAKIADQAVTEAKLAAAFAAVLARRNAENTFAARNQFPSMDLDTTKARLLRGQELRVTAIGNVTGSAIIDLSAANVFTATATGATTFSFSNVPGANQSQIVTLRLTNGGAFTMTWPASTKFAGGTPPTLTAAGIDYLGIYYDLTTATYVVFLLGKDVK